MKENHTAIRQHGISPAALLALLSGDHENALRASIPGGIEAQERAGQREQETLQTLPRELGLAGREPWEAMGFVFGERVDDLFIAVEFPSGWKKNATEHSMWTEIVDHKGRKRGMIFYKAAFYDRSAHAHLRPRFGVDVSYDDAPTRTVSVSDACEVVKFAITGLYIPNWQTDRAEASVRQSAIDAARKRCEDYLRRNFPDFESPVAYWD